MYQSNLPTDNVRKPGGPRRSLNPLSAHLHGSDHPFKGVVGLSPLRLLTSCTRPGQVQDPFVQDPFEPLVRQVPHISEANLQCMGSM